MARQKTKYEKETFELLEEFEESTKSWGWLQDQGTGAAVDRAEKHYLADKAALVKRINALLTARRRAMSRAARIRVLEIYD